MKASVKERADINRIVFIPPKVEVRGYQSYDISRGLIQFIENDSHDWTDTRQKTRVIETALVEKNCHSYLDFGSNLGVQVFQASFKGVEACGVDYNVDYINVCKEITRHLGLPNATFLTDSFRYFEKSSNWDLISLMNIHHHLFGRTDLPMSLMEINRTVLAKCKWFVTQFPTELDKKAIKWTSLYQGKGNYSLSAFLASLGDRDYRILHEDDSRPIFLIRGDLPL